MKRRSIDVGADQQRLVALSNDQIVLLAVVQLGGAFKPIDPEDIAMAADKIAPGKFRWKKYPRQIDLELINNGLRDAVRRIHRMAGFAPPTAVLRELCTKLDFLHVNADQVERIDSALNWTQILGPTETAIITVMKKFGPVIPRVEFMRHCANAGK